MNGPSQITKRGILISFNSSNNTATVLLLEATNDALQNVPVALCYTTANVVVGALCVVEFFDEHNIQDCCVTALFNNT
jgi:hypothetical protein